MNEHCYVVTVNEGCNGKPYHKEAFKTLEDAIVFFKHHAERAKHQWFEELTLEIFPITETYGLTLKDKYQMHKEYTESQKDSPNYISLQCNQMTFEAVLELLKENK